MATKQQSPSPKLVNLVFPFKGVHQSSAIVDQPDGTTARALNVRGYDPIARRDRGGQRPGLVKYQEALEDSAVDGACQVKLSLPQQPTGLSPVKLNRQWQPVTGNSPTPVTLPRTVGLDSGGGLTDTADVASITDIGVTLDLTVLFTNANDQVVIAITPDTNPSGYSTVITLNAKNPGGGRHWIMGDQAGTGGPDQEDLILGVLAPPTNRSLRLFVTVRQGGYHVSTGAFTGSLGFQGFQSIQWTGPYDWVAAGPQTVNVSLSTSAAKSKVTVNSVKQTKHLPGAFDLVLPFLDDADGGSYNPTGIVAARMYNTKSHAMGGVPSVHATHSPTVFMATETFPLGAEWGWTIKGAIDKANAAYTLTAELAVQDDALIVGLGSGGNVLDIIVLLDPDGGVTSPRLTWSHGGGTGHFSLPAAFKSGVFTIEVTYAISGNAKVKFNGLILGSIAIGSGNVPAGNCNVNFYNTENAARWTDVAVTTTGPSYAIVKETVLIAQGGNLWIGDGTAGFTQVDTTPIGSGPAYVVGNEMSIAAMDGWFYVVDGTDQVVRVKATDGTIEVPTPTAGTLPKKARLVFLYHDRLHFTRIIGDEFNLFASAVGDALDHDAGDTTPRGAYELNATQFAGQVGETITACVPYGDQVCVIGMVNSIAVMRGDPKSGGGIDFISRETGMAGPTAWARDPDGRMYFMAHDGLYKMTPDAAPKPVSHGRLDESLGEVRFASTRVIMAWDPREYGLKIYLLPTTAEAPTPVVYWDQRKDAFWLDQYPPGIGPTCVAVLTGQGGADRAVVLGGWDGVLRVVDPDAVDDDGTAIESLVQYTPVQLLGPMMVAKVTEMRFVWGDGGPGGFSATYSVRLGNDATSAGSADPQNIRTITTGGYETLDRNRSRGACMVLEISNLELGLAWQIERCTALALESGRIRT